MSDNNKPRRKPLMLTTPGITEKRLCKCPLGTEGEMTPGDDRANPYRSAEEAEYVRRYREKEKQQRDEMEPGENAFYGPMEDPTEGTDPFIFDDFKPESPPFLPTDTSEETSGPSLLALLSGP